MLPRPCFGQLQRGCRCSDWPQALILVTCRLADRPLTHLLLASHVSLRASQISTGRPGSWWGQRTSGLHHLPTYSCSTTAAIMDPAKGGHPASQHLPLFLPLASSAMIGHSSSMLLLARLSVPLSACQFASVRRYSGARATGSGRQPEAVKSCSQTWTHALTCG